MRRLAKYLLIMALLPALAGCVVVSMHTTRLVRVHVTSKRDNKPVCGALVEVHYDQYAGYGVYYVLRVPKPVSARTDSNVISIIPLATFSQYINFFVNGNKYGVSMPLIRDGGVPECTAIYKPPELNVRLDPLK